MLPQIMMEGHTEGNNEGRPEELPDLDDIRITVCNGLIVGWRKD